MCALCTHGFIEIIMCSRASIRTILLTNYLYTTSILLIIDYNMNVIARNLQITDS